MGLGALITELRAGEDATLVRNLPAEAVVRFAGTSTLHDFGGKLPAQPSSLILSNDTWFATAEVLSG